MTNFIVTLSWVEDTGTIRIDAKGLPEAIAKIRMAFPHFLLSQTTSVHFESRAHVWGANFKTGEVRLIYSALGAHEVDPVAPINCLDI